MLGLFLRKFYQMGFTPPASVFLMYEAVLVTYGRNIWQETLESHRLRDSHGLKLLSVLMTVKLCI